MTAPWETVDQKAPWETIDQVPISEERSFTEGVKSELSLTNNIGVRAGGLLMEDTFNRLGLGDIVDANRNARKFEQWQPQIWDAQDKLNIIEDKNSSEYQLAWETLQTIRKNFTDDMNGIYDPNADFNFGDFVDAAKNNFGFMAGSMAGTLLSDPALLAIPGGWVKAGNAALKASKNLSKAKQITAKLSAQVTGGASVGLGFGATENVLTQLEENPDAPLNFERVMNSSLPVAAISGVLPLLGAVVKVPISKISEVMEASKIKKIEIDAQRLYAENIKDGVPALNKQAAVERSIAKHSPTKKLPLSDIDVYMSDAAIASRVSKDANKGIVGKTVDSVGKVLKEGKNVLNDLTQPIISNLRAMGLPHIAKQLDEHDLNLGTDISQKMDTQNVFSKEFGQLTESEQALAAINLNNGTFDNVSRRFNDAFNDSVKNVRLLLNKEFEEMESVGMKVGKTPNYFPREFDHKAFIQSKGVDPALINKDLAKFINDKHGFKGAMKFNVSEMTPDVIRKYLDENDIAQVLNSKIFQGKETLKSGTSSLKKRTVFQVEPENMQFYSDPRAALHNHISRVTPKIHDRRFFGGKRIDEDVEALGQKPNDANLTSGYIKDHLARMLSKGDILPSDLDRVEKLLRARFIGAKEKAHPFVNGTKNLLYAATLGNPLAASTQLGDMGAAVYMNGFVKGVNGIIGESIEGTRFKMKDFGLETIPEIESMGATQKFMDWTLRAGGFKAMDRLGKETILNSTYQKLRSVVKNKSDKETFQFFKDRYGQRLGNSEVQKIIDGVKTGDPKNPDARLAMYSDLTRVQPISMSQMPVAYLNNPNMRIFFMLKTFTLKQIDLMRNEVVNELRNSAKTGHKRNIVKATMNLGKIAGTIGLANMGVDFGKRWLVGKETDLPDLMIDAALRNYGLSTYTTDSILRGDLTKAAGSILLPPVSVIENPVKELFGVDTKGRWIDSIPLVGRTLRTANEAIDEHF